MMTAHNTMENDNMKEFNPALERAHPDDDTVVRSAILVADGSEGWLVQYDVADAPWVANVVAGMIKWAHPVDYDVTQLRHLKPHPFETDENIGSCEPDPVIIRWDKTGNVWHTDRENVGRYSVRRPAKRQAYAAYLNGKIINVEASPDYEVVKRGVEYRIRTAIKIANADEKVKA
jgi:hypothetical protein